MSDANNKRDEFELTDKTVFGFVIGMTICAIAVYLNQTLFRSVRNNRQGSM